MEYLNVSMICTSIPNFVPPSFLIAFLTLSVSSLEYKVAEPYAQSRVFHYCVVVVVIIINGYTFNRGLIVMDNVGGKLDVVVVLIRGWAMSDTMGLRHIGLRLHWLDGIE